MNQLKPFSPNKPLHFSVYWGRKATILSIAVLISSFFVVGQTTEPQHFDMKILFEKASLSASGCFRIPALATAPNGDLIAAIDERVNDCADLKGNTDINIVIRRSLDNGETWSAIETVVDYPFGQSASDPSMIVDKQTGLVFLFFNYMDLLNANDIYHFKVIKSNDNGKTWSKPEDITNQIAPLEWKNDFMFVTSGKGTQTKKGKLLHTLVNLDKGLHLFASDDNGQSWYLLQTPLIPGDESKVIELADGSWMVSSRINNHKGQRTVHLSSDEGKTWATHSDTSLLDPGCNASLIRFEKEGENSESNILLFSNANHPKERQNMTIKVSYDNGKSWAKQKTIYAGSAAYSSMTVLKNGEIGVFFEKDNYTENVFVRFTLEDLVP